MQKGQINVQTENIFPIIKKFLYSDHEIFLRELVSNAVDAIQKLKALSSMGEFNEEVTDPQVEVIINKELGTLTIKDNGLGMTADEVEKYINQIAFSGAEEFVQKYKDKTDAGIIGHFGLGFYSAFMVSKNVEIVTKSFREGSVPVKWECDGSPNYELSETEKEGRGTTITLFIDDDSKEFLEDARIGGILDKYCKFLPVPIKFGTKKETVKAEKEGEKDTELEVDNIINISDPAWVKAPSSLTDEDYKTFYNQLYPFTEDPLFNIHINVDYPFNLTGILYFPRLKKQVEVQKNKIQLFSNQVFITDSVEGVVPEFLTLLHGVLDSPDIPLNVSRSYLQSDGNVKKIAAHITKKVADKLVEIFKNDREDFEKKWDDIKVFIEYGMLTEDKFYDRVKDIVVFKQVGENKYFTFEEWKEKIKDNHTDKDGKLVVLYANNVDQHHTAILDAKERGYEVVELDGPLTSHFLSHMESKLENVSFARIDADSLENLIKKDEDLPSILSDDEKEKVKAIFEEVVDKETYDIQMVNIPTTSMPIQVTQHEFMRRMKEQQAVGGGGMNMFGQLPEKYTLLVNGNHDLVGNLLKDEANKEANAKYLVDLGLLSAQMLKGERLAHFIKDSLAKAAQ